MCWGNEHLAASSNRELHRGQNVTVEIINRKGSVIGMSERFISPHYIGTSRCSPARVEASGTHGPEGVVPRTRDVGDDQVQTSALGGQMIPAVLRHWRFSRSQGHINCSALP
jgi:hypothetical protein